MMPCYQYVPDHRITGARMANHFCDGSLVVPIRSPTRDGRGRVQHSARPDKACKLVPHLESRLCASARSTLSRNHLRGMVAVVHGLVDEVIVLASLPLTITLHSVVHLSA